MCTAAHAKRSAEINVKTYILQHTHEFSDGTEDVKFIGVFSTPEKANQAIQSLTAQPGFKETPTGAAH